MLHPAPYGQTFRLFAVFYHCQELCGEQLHASTCLHAHVQDPRRRNYRGCSEEQTSFFTAGGGCHSARYLHSYMQAPNRSRAPCNPLPEARSSPEAHCWASGRVCATSIRSAHLCAVGLGFPTLFHHAAPTHAEHGAAVIRSPLDGSVLPSILNPAPRKGQCQRLRSKFPAHLWPWERAQCMHGNARC